MDNNFSRALIEGIVRRALRNMKEPPERSIRNLIDMVLSVSESPFQQSFFQSIQKMLQKEQGAYYGLIRDMAVNIDTNRLLSFGMNLGYNSCIMGSNMIREIEQRDGYNIPWSITLELDGSDYEQRTDEYHNLMRQGKKLGIYTWILISKGQPMELLELAKAHSDCAFLLFCTPEEITQSLLDEADSIYNIMFVVRCEQDADQACDHLRRREQLYSVYIPYRISEVEQVMSDDSLCTAESMHPVFTFFIPSEPVCEEQQESIYEKIRALRSSQQYQTIFVDLLCDNRMIDGVISDDACEASFRKDGTLYMSTTQESPVWNLFEHPLEEILKHTFPK